MNSAYATILSASGLDQRGLFQEAATRLGTTAANVEKDFWVCWTLGVLFDADTDTPRLLFKGGTSLSKAYGLIERFSEDIDVTVFRDDLGESATIDELEGLTSKKQRRKRLDRIRDACRSYISGALQERVAEVLEATLGAAGRSRGAGHVEIDRRDPDGQTLLIHYPSVTDGGVGYIERAVKIESGAKSALDPNSPRSINPYIAEETPALDLRIEGVTTIDAERTFWDKVIILHGLRSAFDAQGTLRQDGNRVSRHYYDLYRLLQSSTGDTARDWKLGSECVRHARMFFNRPGFGLEEAEPGRFRLSPVPAMQDSLRRDYEKMSGMIFGDAPQFDDVMDAVREIEARVNASAA